MKTSHNNPETLVLIMMHLSVFFLLCLAIVNAPRVKGQSIHFPKPALNAKQQQVQQIYTSQIGIREKGTNSGAAVEQYLRYVNLPKGNPWCAAFVCWVFGQAGVENPGTGWSPGLFSGSKVIWTRKDSRTRSQEPGFPPSVQIAYSSKPATRSPQLATALEPRTKSQEPGFPQYVPFAYPPKPATCNSQLLTALESRIKSQEPGFPPSVPFAYSSKPATRNPELATPSTGDIFALYFPEKKRIAHVGFIDQWDGTWLITVEGNTNVSGSREGDGVYRKRRLVRTVYQVARYIGFRK